MLTEELRETYDGYYNAAVKRKREISAKDSVREIQRVAGGRSFEHLLDVGAGEGSVVEELETCGLARKITAVEISRSGIEAIRQRNLSSLVESRQFDGYELPYSDKTFDVALAIYVLEHVEHERLFLREVARTASRVIVAVPLEHTLRLDRSRIAGKAIGHINFYTMSTFSNILETAGLQIENAFPYTTSSEYEAFVSPRTGHLKYLVRSAALATAPRLACRVFTYMAIAVCKCL